MFTRFAYRDEIPATSALNRGGITASLIASISRNTPSEQNEIVDKYGNEVNKGLLYNMLHEFSYNSIAFAEQYKRARYHILTINMCLAYVPMYACKQMHLIIPTKLKMREEINMMLCAVMLMFLNSAFYVHMWVK